MSLLSRGPRWSVKFRRGGQATVWPWIQIELRGFGRCLSINLSRQEPLDEPRSR